MTRRKYRGFFGRKARRRCPHSNLAPVYGDMILYNNFYRLWCRDCGRTLDGLVILASRREGEKDL